jgi:hypothetical protein
MSTVRDVSYTITIDQLLPDDDYAIVVSNVDDTTVSEVLQEDGDMGRFLSWSGFDLANSITEPSQAKSNITLITSNYYNGAVQMIPGNSDIDPFLQDRLTEFLTSLVGRRITVSVNYTYLEAFESMLVESPNNKTIYVGFINRRIDNVSSSGGAKFTLECLPLIAQLDRISPNASWQDTTQTYGQIIPSTVGNLLSQDVLDKMIQENTMLEDADLTYVSPAGYADLPNELWSFVLPSRSRLATITEILTPYSRMFYQKSDGSLWITPLFYDDNADEVFNINARDNTETKNWLAFSEVNSAVNLPNRIDVSLGISVPGSFFNVPDYQSLKEVLVSAPYIVDNKISSIPNNKLDYTEVYSTSTRLYNSGKYVMPQIRQLALDNALTDPNGTIGGSLMALYQSWQFMNSGTNLSSLPTSNSIAQLYAQIYLAEINASAYNATVVYDYMAVIDAGDPLGKIVNIANSNDLDYADNLITDTTLSVSADNGSIFIIHTAPLLSILGCWYSAEGLEDE